MIGADYAFGYESVGGFQKAFEDCGGKVVQKIWPALGTKDFGPYIPTIKGDADAVFTLMENLSHEIWKSAVVLLDVDILDRIAQLVE